nr:hypothetical protein [Tanacetum cinerariifolium]
EVNGNCILMANLQQASSSVTQTDSAPVYDSDGSAEETTIVYGMMEEAQDDQSKLRGRFNLLYRDRPVHRHLTVMIKREARMALAQHALILDLQAADRRRQGVIKELLAADHKRQGVTAALATRDANRNDDDSHTSGMGTEGVVGLSQWFEKMESDYNISNYTVACQVKFATYTLQGNALTWWNSHVKTTTHEAAHAMPWRILKKMMTDKYYPWGEIKKLESKMWNLKVKEIDKGERYVDGLPDTIHGSVMATKPKTKQDAIEFATELMNKKINTWVERNGDRRAYKGPRPLCTKCNYHHNDPCAPKCHKCNRFGHLSRGCRNPPKVNTGLIRGATFVLNVVLRGISRRNVQNLKNNNNQGNQVGNAKAQAKVYAVGKAGANPNNNVITGTFLLNKHYASILFDTGADRSFVSTAFSSIIIITPTALDHDYNIELVDGRIVRLNTIIRGCTLNFLNHPFNIDLIPVELGSFDVIISMDWLAKYHTIIICAEKIVRIPFGDKILIVRANITATKDEDKSKGKRLEDLPVVQEFPEVFFPRTCRVYHPPDKWNFESIGYLVLHL